MSNFVRFKSVRWLWLDDRRLEDICLACGHTTSCKNDYFIHQSVFQDSTDANIAMYSKSLYDPPAIYSTNLQTQAPTEFDFYISPSDKFQYETLFDRYSEDDKEVQFSRLEELFVAARIPRSEIIMIWNVVDLRGNHIYNKEQFCWFQHILNVRRRTSKIPTSLPLHIKEKILAGSEPAVERGPYVRPRKEKASVSAKSVGELEEELLNLRGELQTSSKGVESLNNQEALLRITKRELDELALYKRDKIQKLRDALAGSDGGGIGQDRVDINKLLEHKAALEAYQLDIQRQCDQVRAEISREK